MEQTDPNKTVELSLNALRILLFGDDRLEDVRPSSTSIGDTAKVKVIPFGMGQSIKNIDTTEEYFHVELIQTDKAFHAEIWMSFDWRESNTRRSRQQTASQERRIIYEKNAVRLKRLTENLRPFGLDQKPGYLEHLSKQILENYTKGDFTALARVLNIAETLAAFEEEDRNDS